MLERILSYIQHDYSIIKSNTMCCTYKLHVILYNINIVGNINDSIIAVYIKGEAMRKLKTLNSDYVEIDDNFMVSNTSTT